MPKFRTYKGNNYNVSIRPVGVRRCWPLGLFPYFYGSDVVFDVGIRIRDNKELPYQWRLSMWDGQTRLWISQNNNGKLCPYEKHKTINMGTLFVPGQYSLQMRWGHGIVNGKDYELMVAFTIADRDIHVLNWGLVLIGVVGGIIGTLITMAIT